MTIKIQSPRRPSGAADGPDSEGPPQCLSCAAALADADDYRTARVCPVCRFHYTISAWDRIALLTDPGSFHESSRTLIATHRSALEPRFLSALDVERRRTGLADAVITGEAKLNGREIAVAVVDFRFMSGTIGSVAGEKLARVMEAAAGNHRPLLLALASGGARYQEGPVALLQTAKLGFARAKLAQARTPLLCVLSSPVLGAAYAGLGSLADYLIAEPGALVAYTAGRALDDVAFGAETLRRHGLVDDVVDRTQHRALLGNILEALTARARMASSNGEKKAQEQTATLDPWNRVQLARHARRPSAVDYIGRMVDTFVELRGDGAGNDPHEVVCGIATMDGSAVLLVGQQRTVTGEGEAGGWLSPAGFRKAARAFEMAARFWLPVITLVDTPGADPGIQAITDGLGPAMARCLAAVSTLPAPSIAAIIGEGGSEGAVAFAVADRVIMQEHATYSVIAPERAALLLHRDPNRTGEAAGALRLTAADCKNLGVVDVVSPEPEDGAHADHDEAARLLKLTLVRALADLQSQEPEKLARRRRARYRSIGSYSSSVGVQLAHEATELGNAIRHTTVAAAARLRPRRRRRRPRTPEEGQATTDLSNASGSVHEQAEAKEAQ